LRGAGAGGSGGRSECLSRGASKRSSPVAPRLACLSGDVRAHSRRRRERLGLALVAAAARERGHDPVAVDLPNDDESAGWSDYAETVVEAVGDRSDVIVVAHSLGGFTAPLVCERIPVGLLVLVAAMIPSPGELFADWWANTGYEESGQDDVFYHDVPPELAAEAKRRERVETAKALREPWPLDRWPETPTRYLLCRDDRMFVAEWARRHARERLGIEADEIDGGHYVALSRPRELAERLDAYASGVRAT
jgi:pimeloyl-ACP methyl ester carboxylesterase